MTFQKGSDGRYIVFAPWSRLPLGTVVKRGKRWEASTRLGKRVSTASTRAEAAKGLETWCHGTRQKARVA